MRLLAGKQYLGRCSELVYDLNSSFHKNRGQAPIKHNFYDGWSLLNLCVAYWQRQRIVLLTRTLRFGLVLAVGIAAKDGFRIDNAPGYVLSAGVISGALVLFTSTAMWLLHLRTELKGRPNHQSAPESPGNVIKVLDDYVRAEQRRGKSGSGSGTH